MLKKISVICAILFLAKPSFAQEKFTIYKENKTAEHEIGLNKYSFVHHICPDSFYMTQLYPALDYDDMAQIVSAVYHGVTKKDKVQVNYGNITPSEAIITYSVQESPRYGTIYIMFTNFNNATRQFEETPDPKDQLARWYYIKNDRLVYRNDMFTAEREAEVLASPQASALIRLYLFDEHPENDAKINPLIDTLLAADTSTSSELFFTKIYQIQHFLMNDLLKQAQTHLHKLNVFYEEHLEELSKLSIYLQMVKAEVEVMGRI